MPSVRYTVFAHSLMLRNVEPWICMRCLITSNGFMKASLAIVAHAPLVAVLVCQRLSQIASAPIEKKTYLPRQGGGLLHYRPWLASQPRMSRNILHVRVLDAVRTVHDLSPFAHSHLRRVPHLRHPSTTTCIPLLLRWWRSHCRYRCRWRRV